MSDFAPGWPPADRPMTAVDYLLEAAILLDHVEPDVSAGLRAHAARLRDMSAIEGGTSSVRGIVEMINGGPIPPGEPKP